MKPILQETSHKITMWSFVFAVLVVFIHCRWGAEPEVNGVTVSFVSSILGRMAVPFFFIVSGFFIARHIGEDGWWRREITKRLKSLAVPYVCWTLVLAVIIFFETDKILGPGIFGFNLCRLPLVGPLWFLRSLMFFLITTPILAAILNRIGCAAVIVAHFAWIGFAALDVMFQWPEEGGCVGFFRYGYGIEGLAYYMTGLYLGRCGAVRIGRIFSWVLLAIGLAISIGGCALKSQGVFLPIRPSALATPFLLIGLWEVVPPLPLPSFLARCAFPLYVMHCVVILSLRLWGGTGHFCNPWLEFSAGVIIPIVFVFAVRRLAPDVARILFGGRC